MATMHLRLDASESRTWHWILLPPQLLIFAFAFFSPSSKSSNQEQHCDDLGGTLQTNQLVQMLLPRGRARRRDRRAHVCLLGHQVVHGPMFFFVYYLSSPGITMEAMGAHRFWSHKSYKAHGSVRFFLILCNSLANQGTIFHWTRNHRVHHKYSDTFTDLRNYAASEFGAQLYL